LKKNLYTHTFLALIALFLFCNDSFSGNFAIKGETSENNEKLFSIECRDVEIKDLLRAIAKENDLNLIIPAEIKKRVTLSFKDIKIIDALNAILKSNKLDYIIRDNVMRVGTKEDILNEIKEGGGAKDADKSNFVTKVIGLSYADAGELKDAIKGTVPEGSMIGSDGRTNSLLLNVDESNMVGINDIIEKLDTETKQIMIKAEIVETSNDFSKELGVQWGGNYTRNPNYNNSFSTNFPATMNLEGSGGSGTYAVNLPVTSPTAGIGISFGSLTGSGSLDLRLSAMERSGKIHVVSKPRITTLNNKPAKIHSGITFRVRTSTTTTSDEASSSDTDLEEVKAGIDLIVTPKISHDNLIELNIDVTKSEPDFSKVVDGIPGITDKNANTTVLVKNGETTVIGGLMKNAKSESKGAVPFFSKIPILGWFFRSKANVDTYEELTIFITPVLIEGRADISQRKGD